MQQDLGITFVHVTHTQMGAIALADVVVVMEKGNIKQAGPARDLRTLEGAARHSDGASFEL